MPPTPATRTSPRTAPVIGAHRRLVATRLALDHDGVDVALPAKSHPRRLPGVRVRQRRDLGPRVEVGLPRCRPEHAALRAAAWARTDRAGVLLLCLAVQQRLVSPARLLLAWRGVRRTRRRTLLTQVVRSLPSGRVYLDVAWEEIGLALEIDGGHHAAALHPVDDDGLCPAEGVMGGPFCRTQTERPQAVSPTYCAVSVALVM